jgi:phenylalanyl-tRNA synthetase beta chain
LTTAGLEVDSVSVVADGLDGVVVGEIVSVEPHPQADRLRLCEVRDGDGTVSVVCGAPNARSGLKSAFARVGAVLPGGQRLKRAKIRGVESHGMLCSVVELGLGDDAAGILELPEDSPIGADLRDYLALDDHVLDIDLTPNRGDCFSIRGVAREAAANGPWELDEPSIEPLPNEHDETIGVTLAAPTGCARFAGRVIKDVASGTTSPLWLKERLRRVGLRTIHPVVDVTNYVMLELGQPLHGYDLRKIEGDIVARWGRADESLELLDGRSIDLAEDMVVIADAAGPIGLAGIMGGSSTAVDESTTDVFLEAAFFPPAAIAGRARRLGMQTDASMRFERGVDPDGQARAIERATALLIDIAGGSAGPLIDVSEPSHLPSPATISLRSERIASLLGQALPPQTIEGALVALGMSVAGDGHGAWRVTPPSFRFDLQIEEDLIEEVARVVGYDHIPAVPELTMIRLGDSSESRINEDDLTDALVARGYAEIVTFSFINPELGELISPNAPHLALANPLSQELAVLRRSLWPGLIQAAGKNLSRQRDSLRIFEIGTQYLPGANGTVERRIVAGLAVGPASEEHWDSDPRELDFFDVKGDVECLVAVTARDDSLSFVASKHPALSPGRSASVMLGGEAIGWIGELHPAIGHKLELKKTALVFSLQLEKLLDARLPVYRSYSKYPSLRRDLAVVVPIDVSADALKQCVTVAAGSALQNVKVFDVYRGPGIDSSRKSIGLGLILQETSRTLTDEDADRTVATVVEHLQSELGATIRN